MTGTFAACLLLGASFLAWIKHDFDRLERALLNAADKSERDRELDSVERRRGGPGVKGSGMKQPSIGAPNTSTNQANV